MARLSPKFFFTIESASLGANSPFDEAEVCRALRVEEVRHLGTGAFGDTWWARCGAGERAIKILHDATYPRERLDREVEGLSRAATKHVVRLLEVSELELGNAKRPALHFEFISGGDAASLLRRATWPHAAEVRDFAVGVLRGLQELHARDTIHRDLKLENLALRDAKWHEPVVLDLGLAKMLDWDTITIYPAFMGTCAYMSPEQLQGKVARKTSDMWAIGIVLWILLTRSHPFYDGPDSAVSLEEAKLRVANGPPTLPLSIDEPMRDLATRLLAPMPYERGSASRALRDLTERDQ